MIDFTFFSSKGCGEDLSYLFESYIKELELKLWDNAYEKKQRIQYRDLAILYPRSSLPRGTVIIDETNTACNRLYNKAVQIRDIWGSLTRAKRYLTVHKLSHLFLEYSSNLPPQINRAWEKYHHFKGEELLNEI